MGATGREPGPGRAPLVWALAFVGVGLLVVLSTREPEPLVERGTEAPPGTAPTPGTAAPGGPRAPRELDPRAAEACAGDPARELTDRLAAIGSLAACRAEGAAAIGRLLDRERPEDPQAAPLRAAAITALARFPEDPGARARLARGLDSAVSREERLLVLAVLGGAGDVVWVRGLVEPLVRDPDAGIREKAAAVLERLRAR